MTAPFKDFMAAVDRQIERKKFNPNLTMGEYAAMSEADKAEWDRRLIDSWTDPPVRDTEPRGFNDELFTASGARKGGMEPWEWGE